MIHAAYLCLTLMFLPLTYVPTVFNRFKVPAVVTLILGVSNVLFAYGLTHMLQLGLYGIASAGAMVLLIKNIVFLPFYTVPGSRIRNVPSFTSIRWFHLQERYSFGASV
nr:hypothetical protein P5627_06810 [Bacillus safensis]